MLLGRCQNATDYSNSMGRGPEQERFSITLQMRLAAVNRSHTSLRRGLCLFGLAVCVAMLSACAAFRSYNVELGQTLDLVSVGRIESALDRYERKGDRKDLLYYLEKGELLRLAGRYAESQQAWFEADRRVGEWEQQARLRPEMLLRDAGSLLVNDKSRAYTGQDFEKVMLSTRIALNHLALGEWDKARVAIKRTHEREAIIAALRAEQVRRSEEAAEEKGQTRDFRELNGYPVQTIDSPEVNALRNSYQNAFSHYLAGFLYEALGEISLASAGYRQAIELQPGVALLEQGLAGLDTRHTQRLGDSMRSSGQTDLLIVVETGLAPARKSLNVNLPIPTDDGLLLAPVSFPVLYPQRRPGATGGILVDDDLQVEGAAITSVDLMSRRALKDEMPWIMVRAVTRATVKAALQRAVRKEDKSGIGGAATMIGAILTEQADERVWRSLPADIAVARARVATGVHDIDVDIGNSRHTFRVDIDGPFAVMSVRQIGTGTYMSLSPALPATAVQADAGGVRMGPNTDTEELL